jgi:predicted RNase H-like HicB family nuclease
MQVHFTVTLWREGSQFIAMATPLDVASSGPTPEAARAALNEAVTLFLRSAADRGTLSEVLEECGYTRRGDHWTLPAPVSSEPAQITLPAA